MTTTVMTRAGEVGVRVGDSAGDEAAGGDESSGHQGDTAGGHVGHDALLHLSIGTLDRRNDLFLIDVPRDTPRHRGTCTMA